MWRHSFDEVRGSGVLHVQRDRPFATFQDIQVIIRNLEDSIVI